MTGLQISIIVLGAINVVGCMCRTDAMTWRTHKWGPQLLFMGLGLVAVACSLFAAWNVDLEFSVCAQLGVSIVLLHTLPAYRDGPRLRDCRDSVLRQLREDA